MTGSDLIGPAVVAAVVSGIVSLAGIVVSTRTTRRLHSEKLDFDEKLAEKRYTFDRDLAERKFRYDRELHDHKRRTEFGEELLAAFYKFRDVIRAVRSPLAHGEEGATRTRSESEDPDLTRSKDTYFVPLERISKQGDFLSDFFSKRYRARAIFREDLERAYQLANEIVSSIQVSAGMLIRSVGDGLRRDRAYLEKFEADIWDGFGADRDQVTPKLQTAVQLVENAIGPIVEATTEKK